MITYLGSYTVGGLFPSLMGFVAFARAKLAGTLAGNLRLAASASLVLPQVRAAIAARLAAQMAATPPSVKVSTVANASVIASLQAQLAAYARLQPMLAQAGLDVYLYDGPADRFGSEVAGAIGGGLPGATSPSMHINSLVIATRYPAAFAALKELLS